MKNTKTKTPSKKTKLTPALMTALGFKLNKPSGEWYHQNMHALCVPASHYQEAEYYNLESLARHMIRVFWNHGFDKSAKLHTSPCDFRAEVSPFTINK